MELTVDAESCLLMTKSVIVRFLDSDVGVYPVDERLHGRGAGGAVTQVLVWEWEGKGEM